MSNNTFFDNDWLELQRKYWENWTNMSQKAAGLDSAAGAKTPWEGALDHWWQAMSPGASDFSKTFMEKMMEQSKSVFRMADVFTKQPGEGAAAGDMTYWMKALEDMQKQFSGSLGDGGDAMQRMMSFWEKPLDHLQRMMSSMSPMPGDMFRNMEHDLIKERLDRALSSPGLGYTREGQGRYQDLMRSAIDYQTAQREYANFYNRLGTKSIQRMGCFIQDAIESGESITSAREFYDNWVKCYEASYAEEVATPEYAQIHGRLINAQMTLKKRIGDMVDNSLSSLDMPTRSELNTLQTRLQETRRDNKKLHHTLQALEKQVAALSDKVPATAIKAPAAAKTAPRRKPAAKTSGAADS